MTKYRSWTIWSDLTFLQSVMTMHRPVQKLLRRTHEERNAAMGMT